LHLEDGVPLFHQFRLRLQRCASLTEQLRYDTLRGADGGHPVSK
jgi:hypothetical protein